MEEQEFNLLTKEEFTENSFFLPGFILERQFSEIQTRTFDTVNTTSKYTYIVSIVLLIIEPEFSQLIQLWFIISCSKDSSPMKLCIHLCQV